MTDLHPHWTATDTHPEPATQKQAGTHVPVEQRHVSRLPAALVGMTLVILVGAGFFKGLTSLRAQLLEEVTINITPADGVTPATVTVAPGQDIAWMNVSDSPHIFTSSTLCDSVGACLYSDIILTGDTARYRVPVDVPAGEYAYASEIDPLVQGTIIVAGEPIEGALEGPPEDLPPDTAAIEDSTIDTPTETPPPEPAPTPEPATETGATEGMDALLEAMVRQQATTEQIDLPNTAPVDSGQEPALNTVAQVDVPLTAEPSAPSGVAPRAPGEIPRNPYTVGSPLTASVESTTSMHSGAPAPAVTLHAPSTQPQTGMAVWMIVLASIMGFTIVGRRMLQRTQVVAS